MNPRPNAGILRSTYTLFRDFFRKAEVTRRWNLRTDIPWKECRARSSPVIADLVETLYAMELYLPDYLAQMIPQARADRGHAWMLATWGYEESKHALALAEWLLRSGHRTARQLADLEAEVLARPWELPFQSTRAMVCFCMVQEQATWLHYHNLGKLVDDDGDPALERILQLIAADERAHFNYFRSVVAVYLEWDRSGTLELLRPVLSGFQMPAIHLLRDADKRLEEMRELRIYDEEMRGQEVLEPMLAELNVSRAELWQRQALVAIQ